MSRSRRNTPYGSRNNSRTTSRTSSPTLAISVEEIPLLGPQDPEFAVASYFTKLKSGSLEAIKPTLTTTSSQTDSTAIKSRAVFSQTDEQLAPEFVKTTTIAINTDPVFIQKSDLDLLWAAIKRSQKVSFKPADEDTVVQIASILENHTKILTFLQSSAKVEKHSISKLKSKFHCYLIPTLLGLIIIIIISVLIFTLK